MAKSLDDIARIRDNIKLMRIMAFIMLCCVLAAWGVIWTKNVSVAVHILIVSAVLTSFYNIFDSTRQIRGLDDFLIYYALKVIKDKNGGNYGQLLKFPKKMGISKKDVIDFHLGMENKEGWKVEETKESYLLVRV